MDRFSCIVLAVVAQLTCCLAEEDYSTWIWQVKNDTASNPGNSSDFSFGGASFWSSKAKPAAGGKYYVPAGMTNYTSNKSSYFDFKGDSLAIAGVLRFATGSGKTVTYPELRLLDGSMLLYKSVGTLAGDLKIESSMDDPTVLLYDYQVTTSKTYTVKIASRLIGDETAAMRLERSLASVPKQTVTRSFAGDMSSYLGTIVLADSNSTFIAAQFVGFPGTLAYACKCKLTIPVGYAGTVAAVEGYVIDATANNAQKFAAYDGGVLSFGAGRSVGDLALGSGGNLRLAFDGTSAGVVTVTNSFRVSAGVQIELDGFSAVALTNGTKDVAMIRLEDAAAQTPPDVSRLKLKTLACGLPNAAAFTWVSGADGSRTLVLNWKRTVILARKENENFMTDESHRDFWSDGELPHAGCDYLISGGSYTWSSPERLAFPGDSLVYDNVTVYMQSGKSLDADNLILNGFTATIYASDKNWSGGITVMKGGAQFNIYQNQYICIDSEVSGVGQLKFSGSTNNKQTEPYGRAELTGRNVDFNGRIVITTPVSGASGSKPATPDTENDYLTKFYLSDGSNLGGAFLADSETYKAIVVENFSRVICRNSVSIDEPTRGVYVASGAQFAVPAADAVLSIGTSITYNGELWKKGAGTMALGAPALFTDGNPSTDPAEGRNVLKVMEGRIKPVASSATDGLALSFEEGTGIIVPAAGTTGFLSVRTGSSITVNTDSGKLPVYFDLNGLDVSPVALTIPIVTVRDRTAAEEVAKTVLPQPRVGSNAFKSIDVTENADGTFTVRALYAFKAFTVVIR